MERSAHDTNGRDDVSRLASEAMCHYCFHVLESRFRGLQPGPPPDCIPNFDAAIFVSYTALPGTRHEELRGCKGSHSTRPLHEQLRRFALCSAFEDTRFQRITAAELPRLTCTVSILAGFERIPSCYDWEVGIHGLKIEFADPADGRMYYGTFLPHVAVQMRWTREQTVDHLIAKAGYRGAVTPQLLSKMYVERFRDSQCASPHSAYEAVQRRSESAPMQRRSSTHSQRSNHSSSGDLRRASRDRDTRQAPVAAHTLQRGSSSR